MLHNFEQIHYPDDIDIDIEIDFVFDTDTNRIYLPFY